MAKAAAIIAVAIVIGPSIVAFATKKVFLTIEICNQLTPISFAFDEVIILLQAEIHKWCVGYFLFLIVGGVFKEEKACLKRLNAENQT